MYIRAVIASQQLAIIASSYMYSEEDGRSEFEND